MKLAKIILHILLAAVLTGSAGCRHQGEVKPPGPESGSGQSPVSAVSELTGRTENSGKTKSEYPAGQPKKSAACWLTFDHLPLLLPQIQAQARKDGMDALCVQPDSGQSQIFLIVAENKTQAGQLNGFFYWLAGLSPQEQEDSPLLLGLDKLFRESARTAVLSDGNFSEPEVVNLLDLSLRQILKDDYQPEILNYILTCYRREFSRRLQGQQPANQTFRKKFQPIEVNYEAAIYSSVSFRKLSDCVNPD